MSYEAGRREDGSTPVREKRPVRIEILGRRFTVRSDDDDAYIRELVNFVNQKLAEIGRSTGRVDTEQVALLTALDLADSLIRERREKVADQRSILDQARDLLEAIQGMTAALRAESEDELTGNAFLERTAASIELEAPVSDAVAPRPDEHAINVHGRRATLEIPVRSGRRALGT